MTAIHPIGLIGYGGFGQFLRRSWSVLNGVNIRAICDAIKPDQLAGAVFFADWRELVASPEIEIVAIATPPHTHAEMACTAMEAGKHVLIEKPLATNLEDARRIIETRDRTGRVAAVDYVLRFNPVLEVVFDWSRSGEFGPLRRVVVENYAQDETLPPDHWFWNPELSGGILVEHAVHFIDVVNACASGEPVHTEGLRLQRTPYQEDRMMLTTVYSDGLIASQYHEFARPRVFEHTSLRFVFDLAQLDLEGWIPLGGRIRALTNARTRGALTRLPGFQPVDPGPGPLARVVPGPAYIGGHPYDVDEVLEGVFAIDDSKEAVYGASLRAVLLDLIEGIENPGHLLRTPLEAGLTSLGIALEATRSARERDLSALR